MAWKTVMISKPARLSVHHSSLKIQQDQEVHFPLEDISCLMLESNQISLTSRLLSECSERGIAVYTCDQKHTPNGVALPFAANYRHSKMVKSQIEISQPFRKKCWQKIIQKKILNQAKTLRLCQREKAANRLEVLAQSVKSGDTTHREGVAARIFFAALYGKDFSRNREQEDWMNGALNYGYTILRGAMTRSLTSSGFQPALGIFHDNNLNAMNLADDLMEPLRPLVDLWTFFAQENHMENNLTREDRSALVALLGMDWNLEGEVSTTLIVADRMASSLAQAYLEKKVDHLILPDLLPLQAHHNE